MKTQHPHHRQDSPIHVNVEPPTPTPNKEQLIHHQDHQSHYNPPHPLTHTAEDDPELGSPSPPIGATNAGFMSPAKRHLLLYPRSMPRDLPMEPPEMDNLSATSYGDGSVMPEKGGGGNSKTPSTNTKWWRRRQAFRHRRFWRVMFWVQFIMIVCIFIFVLAITGLSVYVVIEIQNAIERADFAIRHNPVSNVMSRIRNTFGTRTPAPQ